MLQINSDESSELEIAEFARHATSLGRRETARRGLGQVFTPAPLGRFMASMFLNLSGDLKVLDPGAGVGSLTAALCERVFATASQPKSLHIECFEIEPTFVPQLNSLLAACVSKAQGTGIVASSLLRQRDFILAAADPLEQTLVNDGGFSHVIMNPPYGKIRSDSAHRNALRGLGIEATNFYSAFALVAVRLLRPGGELVAVIPRSFCNGVYFNSFRRHFLSEIRLQSIHTIGSRDAAFADDAVLQENVIVHGIKGADTATVRITSSAGCDFARDDVSGRVITEDLTELTADYEAVVGRSDTNRTISLPVSEIDMAVVREVGSARSRLSELGIEVSTGPIVEFRHREYIQPVGDHRSVPLLRSTNIANGHLSLQISGNEAGTICDTDQTRKWLWRNQGYYVLTRRITAKEESKRVVAQVYRSDRPAGYVGFENHLNVFHENKRGLPKETAFGLCVFLNSSIVDRYFRLISGNTQVNASDLRALPYPTLGELNRIGKSVGESELTQTEIDAILKEYLVSIESPVDPVPTQRRIDEAIKVLNDLGMPRQQVNQRSALTLLALINLAPSGSWQNLRRPLLGITPIMDFAREHYGVTYAPNTRETFRRHSMHQFVEAGIAIMNPDDPSRPVNSPNTCYQVSELAANTLLSFATNSWEMKVREFRRRNQALAERWAKRRQFEMVPARLPDGTTLELSPGAHSELVAEVITEFASRFVPGAEVVYVGDTGDRTAYVDGALLDGLGMSIDTHGKLPDVILYSRRKKWLLLVEAVTSHGPINSKRYHELSELFTTGSDILVLVTVFVDRATMARHINHIAWETEVWCADAPDHMIHFDGEKFIGALGR